MSKIAVVGAGGTGYSVAAELSARGFEVWLCDIFGAEKDKTEFDFSIKMAGDIVGTTKIHAITTDIRKALENTERIICCTVSNRDAEVAEKIAPFLSPGSMVLISAGNLGSLIYHRIFKNSAAADIVVGETAGNLFSCRHTKEDEVFFGGVYEPKKAAAFPACDTEKLLEGFKGIYDLEAAESILETAFNAPNLLSHISLTVVNAGAIEKNEGTYYSFKQAICPSTIAIVDALWKEKKAVMDALGMPCGPSPSGNFKKYADPENHSFDNFKNLSGPDSMQERHITEDIPVIGCLFLSVARFVGVETPLYRALVTVASAINHTDYYKDGRTLENLGLGELRGVKIREYFKNEK